MIDTWKDLTPEEYDRRMLDLIIMDINYAQKFFKASQLTDYDRKINWLKSKIKLK